MLKLHRSNIYPENEFSHSKSGNVKPHLRRHVMHSLLQDPVIYTPDPVIYTFLAEGDPIAFYIMEQKGPFVTSPKQSAIRIWSLVLDSLSRLRDSGVDQLLLFCSCVIILFANISCYLRITPVASFIPECCFWGDITLRNAGISIKQTNKHINKKTGLASN